jgi:hypothetical protein
MSALFCTFIILGGCENPVQDDDPVPAPNLNVLVVPGDRQLTLVWNEIPEALSYELYYGDAETTTNGVERPESPGLDVSLDGASARITRLSNGTTYYLWVKADRRAGAVFSEPVRGIPSDRAVPPEAPRNVTATGLDGCLYVSWDPAEGAVSYEVWLGSGVSGEPERKAETSLLYASIGGLENDVLYHVWVKALNSAGTVTSVPITGTPETTGAFESAEALGAYLEGLPQNTAGRPYGVMLKGNLETDFKWAGHSLGSVFKALGGRYVALDLSACTGTFLGAELDPGTVNVSNRDRLVSCVLPVSLEELGDHAFRGCTSLESVSIPDDLESLGAYVFYGCTSLESISMPSYLAGIGAYAFYGCTSLESVSMPEALESLGAYAFQDCTSLKTINLPPDLENIGAYTFGGCLSLETVGFPDILMVIGNSAFSGCTSLETISLPEGFTTIETNVFQNCTSLKTISLPSSFTTMGNYAFSGCTSLEGIVLPEGLGTMGTYVFQNCTSLKTISLPPDLENIDAYTFDGCSSLETVGFPDSLKGIGNYAFRNCASLEEIVLPGTLYSLGTYVFQNCTSLKTISLLSLNTIGNYAFSGCTSLKGIVLPEGPSTTGTYILANCTSLASVTLPSTLGSLGNYALQNVGTLADSLTLVVYPVTPPSTGTNTFTGMRTENLVVKVPAESVAAYQAATRWSNFTNNIQALE